jgi:hypothetical protein
MKDASPRPWRYTANTSDLYDSGAAFFVLARHPAGEFDVCEIHGTLGCEEADAALIVRAVNAHDALVEALEAVYEAFIDTGLDASWEVADSKARAALRLARGDD